MTSDDKKATEHGPLIEELRQSVLKHTSGDRQARLLERLDRLEESVNSSAFGGHVKALIEEAEEEAAAVAPFLSRLSSLLP
jgi:hypothetical protein